MKALFVLLLPLTLVLCLPGTGAADEPRAWVAWPRPAPPVTVRMGRARGRYRRSMRCRPADAIAALQAFRAATRKGTVMLRIAKGLDDADITAVATYFATLRQR